MNKITFQILLAGTIFISCHHNPSTDSSDASTSSYTVNSITLQRIEGDCQDDPHQQFCVVISFRYPEVKNGPLPLQKAVASWCSNVLSSLLDPEMETDEEITVKDLNRTIEKYLENIKMMALEVPDQSFHYTFEVTDTLLLQNEQYLTLRMDAYQETGTAHPNATSALATFDLATGRRLRPIDLVKDLEKLYAVAEQKFRETQKEAFANGFDFTESWPFQLTENVGLTTEGLFFCYVPYEVTPYTMGFTEFVIPYHQLEKL